jgi:hypothetical protein
MLSSDAGLAAAPTGSANNTMIIQINTPVFFITPPNLKFELKMCRKKLR